ncbi:nucleotidyltransferase family protein [Pontibacter vulgaris]|uniref:nucleotidyltransferase family protein n=1 Tax=Pontibacter vulgaris TaxID=2905679 RepID=UPI001FA6EFB0|nr:nucleotidyltransferase family protein [Pontibacter vulgaris]
MTKASTPLPQPASRAVSKKQLSDSNNDLNYWLAQPATARLAALQHLRRQYSILVPMELTNDFQDFIKILNACHAEYLVAGGFAVAVYGYPRYTGDIDIWVKPTKDNAARVLQALKEFGYTEGQVTSEDLVTPEIVVQLGYPPNRIDLATGLAGVEFETCWNNKVSMPFGDTMAYFISLDDLKQNKKTTARQQDLLDLQNLPD